MKKSVWVVLVVATLVLAACGPAMVPATGPTTETGEVFTIALPRLVINFDANGNPSVLGLNLADVGKYTGMNLAGMQLNKFYIDWMTNANVQNIELRQTGDGVAVFVNGQPLPHIGWSDASLQATSDLAGLFNVQNTEMIRKFLPIVRRLGLDLVVTFPRAEGAAEIPLVDPSQAIAAAAAKPSDEPASAVVQFEVKYDENGVPGILGITAADLAAMGISAPLALHPAYVAMLQQHNIQSMELRGKSDGLFIYINGQPLPNIVWDDTFLNNAASLYAQMNPQSPYIDVAKTVLPLVNKADIAVLVHFPVAAGQAPIAVKMH
jgi:sulfur carrier protein ThiS